MMIFMARKVDELGRIVLPAELRKALGIDTGTALDIRVNENDQIVLLKSAPKCKVCER